MSTREELTRTIDAAAAGVTVGALFEILPAISAILSIVWLLLRIYYSILDIKHKKAQMKDGGN